MSIKLNKLTPGIGDGYSTVFDVQQIPNHGSVDKTKAYMLVDSEREGVHGGALRLSMNDLRIIYEMLGILFSAGE